MTTEFPNGDDVISTLARICDAEGLERAAAIARSADHRFERTGYDNWNGGTYLYTLTMLISPESYARLGKERDELEMVLTDRIKPVIESFSSDLVSVQIRPRMQEAANRKDNSGKITQITRRDIIDYFAVSSTPWWGSLDESIFLGRLYDMSKIPSTDHRFKTAAGDIHQHRVNNDDWPDDWVFTDERFSLDKSDEKFLRFLAETTHPAVRRNPEEVANLVSELNRRLKGDGWELAEAEAISGRPTYAAQRLRSGAVTAIIRARVAADVLDAAWMRDEIRRMEKAIDVDPTLAIGTAKELVETCCKTILNRRGKPPAKTDDIPKLVKATAKELKLVPEGIPEAARGAEIVKGILRNLGTIMQGIAELRGLYGTGHGRDGKHRGLKPRHARLAVSSAVAFVDFIVETYREREEQEPSELKPPSKA